MITALNIEEKHTKGIGRLFCAFRQNRIRVDHRYCDSAAIKCVTYEKFRRRVSWSAIDRFVKSQRGCVLCPPALELPEELGYRRFESTELMERMCENAALSLLKRIGDRRVRVVLVDRAGERLSMCRYLADFCDVLEVVTDAPRIYLDEAEALLSDKGAIMRIHTCEDVIAQAQLIIAPSRLTEVLPADREALILSGSQPRVRQNSSVIYEYFFELPEKYASIRPEFLDDMYFASALYVMSRSHELGSYSFRYCSDGVTIHTPSSLAKMLLRDSTE